MYVKLNARGLNMRVEKVRIPVGARRMPALVLRPLQQRSDAPGVLWLHGGGYLTGMKERVFLPRAGCGWTGGATLLA